MKQRLARRAGQKRVWDDEQDKKLVLSIAELGPKIWDNKTQGLGNRTGKQCRERWNNQINPFLMKAPWSKEENWILFLMQMTRGNRWSKFKSVLVGRSDNSIKN